MQAYIYWTNSTTGAIGRAKLDGTDVNETFIADPGTLAVSVAVNSTHIYWTAPQAGLGMPPGPNAIGRANLNGTGIEQNFIALATPQNTLAGVAVNDKYIYWAPTGSYPMTEAIGRAKLDGTGINETFIAISGATGWAAVAVNDAHIYWNSGFGTNPAYIVQAKLDGTDVKEHFIPVTVPTSESPHVVVNLAVDGTYIYWTSMTPSGASCIGRAKLDGTDINGNFIHISGTSGWAAVAVDDAHIYWTYFTGQVASIGRAKLDGTDINENFLPIASPSLGVAVWPGPSQPSPPGGQGHGPPGISSNLPQVGEIIIENAEGAIIEEIPNLGVGAQGGTVTRKEPGPGVVPPDPTSSDPLRRRQG